RRSYRQAGRRRRARAYRQGEDVVTRGGAWSRGQLGCSPRSPCKSGAVAKRYVAGRQHAACLAGHAAANWEQSRRAPSGLTFVRLARMRNIGLFAFGVTSLLIVPAALHGLTAGPKQVT